MPLGAGATAAGSTAAGYGTFITAPVTSTVPYPDAQTGLPQTGPLVDPRSQDYVYTADGRQVGFATVPALVQFCLRTTLNSSAIRGLGIGLSSLQDKTPNFQRQVSAVLSQALAPLVKQGLVQIVSVDTADSPYQPSGTVGILTWRDLTQAPVGGVTGAPTNEYKTAF